MSNEEINRKIAVIFATDLVGYSKHMEKDEDAQKFFLKAKEQGLTRKRLSLFVNNKKVLDDFIEKLKPLGSLD
tara:strand:+ start:174 stop:392 length:219 start_codon:yes stop_codon:yes gene_type:complete